MLSRLSALAVMLWLLAVLLRLTFLPIGIGRWL